jgi:putative spermidine/putrescine transport system ATP-binding protein
MTHLTLNNISKQFSNNQVVQDFNLIVDKGEFVSFLGPSGCGKTTTLRMIAGFEIPTTGTVILDDEDITSKAPNQRNVGMVFQAYALFPNLTVAQNIGFGLRIRKEKKQPLIVVLLDACIDSPQKKGDSYPYQLSGGTTRCLAAGYSS